MIRNIFCLYTYFRFFFWQNINIQLILKRRGKRKTKKIGSSSSSSSWKTVSNNSSALVRQTFMAILRMHLKIYLNCVTDMCYWLVYGVRCACVYVDMCVSMSMPDLRPSVLYRETVFQHFDVSDYYFDFDKKKKETTNNWLVSN